MPDVKYFAGIKAAQQAIPAHDGGSLEPFDFAVLGASSALGKAIGGLTRRGIVPLYALARRFRPILPLAGFLHITRDEQVRDVLRRPADFTVPFGPEMAELGHGATFLLGLDGAEHDRLRRTLARMIEPGDGARFAELSRDFTQSLLDNSAGRIDVVGDLFKRVPAEIALRWFGLSCDDVDAFGDWTLALSALLFGDPYGAPATRRMALNGARRLLLVIDEAIARARRHVRAGHLRPGEGATLVERLVLAQSDEGLSDGDLRAMMLGMVTGFVPTNTLAAARMIDVLLARPEALALARAAALAGDSAAMKRIVLEAGRLSPALSPGQWRYCPRDTTLTVDGRAVTIKAGTTLMVSTMSAMRDHRAVADPQRFRPDRTGPDGRWQEPDLVFGLGPHDCIGKHLALEQIAALFAVLLARPGIARAAGKAGRMQWTGPFPRHLEMRFDTPDASQSMFLVIAPVLSGASKQTVDADLARFGHPASADVRRMLDASGVVHFTSLATIESERGLDVIWELSVDGSKEDALTRIVRHAAPLLTQAFAHCGRAAADDLAGFLRDHVVELHAKPWGPTGLNYNGLGEFPVAGVARQERLARFAERAVGDFLGSEAHRGSHPMLALDHVRRLLRQDRILAINGTDAQRALMAEAAAQKLDAASLRPSSAQLKMTAYRPVSALGGWLAFLKSPDARLIWLPMLAIAALLGWLFWRGHAPSPSLPLDIAAVALRTLLATAAVVVAVPALFLFAIRRAEKRDWVDNSQAPISHIAALGQQEDAPGYAQNHIMAVGEIKPGLLRRLSNAVALWAIRILIVYNYRPGFVLNMGTIHYARWWRLPGTKITAFYSNFDGSWESYLEDFITRAHGGQTAAWSNWKGFPPTKFLVLSGAEDGDRFKRWVRTRQQLVPFWYSRFPALTSDQIRNNALIHAGLSRAQSQDEAEEWLRCFGSMPRISNRIESDEVQALVFNGLKRLKFSAELVIALPPPGERLGEWLNWLRGEPMAQGMSETGMAEAGGATDELVASGVLVPAYGADGRITGHALAHSLTVTFGDRPLVGDASIYDTVPPAPIDMSDASFAQRGDARRMGRRAVFLACSAAGLAKFPAPGSGHACLSETFPPAFRIGMASRGRNLGDSGAAAAANWRWSDGASAGPTAEAVLLVYAETPEDLDFAVTVHRELLENHGGHVHHQLDCAPARIDQDADQHDFEHFGYRDGISQPVIRGTTRASQSVPARDLVEPGEFIIGYANGQGFFPGSALLPPEADIARSLPQMGADQLSRYPDFDGMAATPAQRDFGRNGSFLVLRELRQDVAGFEDFVTRKADELQGRAMPADGGQAAWRDLYKLIGQYPDKDWVKAKLMGRWPNGRPLIGNPVNTPTPAPGDPDAAACRAAERENDFSYGADDPQGLACPFASHIRRTNPRDSKQPGDSAEQVITNRHRLLRRGRTYTRTAADGSVEKGLLFVSLCTDLERQFEFVQQFWSNAPGFHGLSHEPDPIIGSDVPDPLTGCPAERSFSIPTPAGTIRLTGMQNFVEVKAGGYFFLPSRSALTWLCEISLNLHQSGVNQ